MPAYAEYLALEEASPIRHEYVDGEIYAMPRGTPATAAGKLRPEDGKDGRGQTGEPYAFACGAGVTAAGAAAPHSRPVHQ